MRRAAGAVRLVLLLALAALVVALVRRAAAARADLTDPINDAVWPPLPPLPPLVEPVNRTPDSGPVVPEPWVAPVEGECREGYPIKAKAGSGIYHLPGMLNYDRTVPDRCYASATAAEADGFRAAKR